MIKRIKAAYRAFNDPGLIHNAECYLVMKAVGSGRIGDIEFKSVSRSNAVLEMQRNYNYSLREIAEKIINENSP